MLQMVETVTISKNCADQLGEGKVCSAGKVDGLGRERG